MVASDMTTSEGWEDTPLVLMRRILLVDGTAAQQADFTGIKRYVHDLSSGVDDTTGTALTLASVLYDTLQTGDSRWDEDTTGYNFADTVPAAKFPTGDHDYLVEYVFDPVSGDDFHQVHRHAVKGLRVS